MPWRANPYWISKVLSGGGGGPTGIRVLLLVATTFYVATNGVNVASGGTLAAPWLTLAYAMQQITQAYDFGGQAVTLQAVAGRATFTEQLRVTPWVGGGSFTFDGGGGSITYAGAAINIDAAVYLAGGALPGPFTFQNGTFSASKGAATGFVANVYVATPSTCNIGPGVTIGSGDLVQLITLGGASIVPANSFSVSGGAGYLFFGNGGLISGGGVPITITFTNNVTYTGATANSSDATFMFLGGITWNLAGHTVTGKRFNADTAGVLNSGGGGINFIPGTIAGTVTPPGVYI